MTTQQLQRHKQQHCKRQALPFPLLPPPPASAAAVPLAHANIQMKESPHYYQAGAGHPTKHRYFITKPFSPLDTRHRDSAENYTRQPTPARRPAFHHRVLMQSCGCVLPHPSSVTKPAVRAAASVNCPAFSSAAASPFCRAATNSSKANSPSDAP